MFRLVAVAFAMSFFVGPAPAQTAWKIERRATDIGFVARKLGAVLAAGWFERYDATLALDFDAPERSRIKVTIETGSLQAGSALMDGFIRGESMLDAGRHPTASFASARVVRTGERSLEIRGQLTIRSITQPFTVTAVVDGDLERARRGEKLPFRASGTFLRPAFDLGREVNLVDDLVEIVIKGQLSR